ncbi:hypothetical protein QVD17_18551 [Tagetes erecta]|uniref:Arabinogalactan-like protein n=1 Tax=Tagetes erecta TaxID=13708 RepID=A0AAD8KI01_TARER|nr:hypothetical protein QVD17_18551 [Tagetes erecta]
MARRMVGLALISLALVGLAYAAAPHSSPSPAPQSAPPKPAPKAAPKVAPKVAPRAAPKAAPKAPKSAPSHGHSSPPIGRHPAHSPPSPTSIFDAAGAPTDSPADAPSSGTVLKASSVGAMVIASYLLF